MRFTTLTFVLSISLAVGLIGCDTKESAPVGSKSQAPDADPKTAPHLKPVASAQSSTTSPKQIDLHSLALPFFTRNCVQCHGPKKQKGKIRLDTLAWNPQDEKQLEIWQKVADQLMDGEMPPEKQPRPDAKELQTIIAHIQASLNDAGKQLGPKQVLLRRLNRIQYRNTIRDLLHIDVSMDDPTASFPADDVVDGFDNIGDGLMMSDFLLRQYLHVARAAVDRATFNSERPKPMTYRMFDKSKRKFNFLSKGYCPSDRGVIYLYMNDEREPGDTRGQVLTSSNDGASHDGWYEFAFEVESKGRGNFAKELGKQKRNDWQVYHPEDLHRLEIYFSAPAGTTPVQTRNRRLIESIDLPDNKRIKLERRYWITKGWRIEVAFGNGYSTSSRNNYLPLIGAKFDRTAFEKLDKRKQNGLMPNLIHDALEKNDAPRIAVYSASEHGPLYQSWPPPSHRAIYGNRGTAGKTGQSQKDQILDFATRAFRRPVTEQEIEPFIRLASNSPEGLRTAIEAMLCSPRFIYLREAAGQLDDYAIANRLSYFLWNTMPDAVLLDLAAKGRLREPAILDAQLSRMLGDSRSKEFVNGFVWRWLKLQNTIDMAPDPIKFYEYKRHRIANAMLKETQIFFRHLLDKNLSVANFIDSDFAFINADLARFYKIPGVNTTASFQKVALRRAYRRGGLLGQTSVLTASANGVDTSPVVRGIWILENLLGTPPSPPPPGVEIPEPDARGDLTLKQMYAKHRTVPSCNDCHKKIDPIGFALESFDAVGRWRDKYESGEKVDSTGQMPSGEHFDDVTGAKQIMLKNQTLFKRNLASKLLTYATGRIMTPIDRAEIDRVVAQAEGEGGGLRDMVAAVVKSKIFGTK